jgi:hypothetical protein
MKFKLTVSAVLFGALSIFVAQPARAQNAIGGAVKTKPNTVGGLAKPAPVLGGASTPTSPGVKPAAIGTVAKPNVAGTTPIPGSTGSTATSSATASPGASGAPAAMARPNQLPAAQNKGKTAGPVVSNLKCGGGACVARGAKP